MLCLMTWENWLSNSKMHVCAGSSAGSSSGSSPSTRVTSSLWTTVSFPVSRLLLLLLLLLLRLLLLLLLRLLLLLLLLLKERLSGRYHLISASLTPLWLLHVVPFHHTSLQPCSVLSLHVFETEQASHLLHARSLYDLVSHWVSRYILHWS